MLAVRDLVAENGYAALTTAAVARRAGVSTATLYRRWPTKRELVLASTRRMIDVGDVGDADQSDGSDSAPLADRFDTGSLQGDLKALISHKNRALSGATGAALLSLLGELPRDPGLGELLRGELLAATCAHLEQIRDRAQARGEDVGQDVLALDLHAAARLVLGAVLAGIAFSASDEGGDPLSDVEQDLLLRALGCG